MIERFKTGLLIVLVALSLLQSYMLAYSFPTLGAVVKTEQEYELTETMGQKARVDQVIFPEDIVLHLGEDRHSVVFPGNGFYDRIYDRITASEFTGFQRVSGGMRNWSELRRTSVGVELRFGEGIPVQLLQRVMRIDGDLLFLSDSINRVMLLREQDRSTLDIYFFSSDGSTVYEPLRANVTLADLDEFAGLGVYLTPYELWRGGIYLPTAPVEAVEFRFDYESYTAEQMQRNLFFDSEKTRHLVGRNGSQIYTDGKRGLQLESGETWMVYTDPVAPLDSPNNLTNNVLAAVQFVNQHGGWDGMHRFLAPKRHSDGRTIRFQQYYDHYPLLGGSFRYGHIRLVLQQGVVSEYERSLLTRAGRTGESTLRWLPGDEQLLVALDGYGRQREVESLFPAQFVTLSAEGDLYMEPVWGVRLTDGSMQALMKAWPVGTVVEQTEDEETAANGGEAGGQPSSGDGGSGRAGEAEQAEDAGGAADAAAAGDAADAAAGNDSKTADAIDRNVIGSLEREEPVEHADAEEGRAEATGVDPLLPKVPPYVEELEDEG